MHIFDKFTKILDYPIYLMAKSK